MRSNCVLLAVLSLLAIPSLGMTGLERGEAIAAWVTVFGALATGLVWLGSQYRKWRSAIVADALARQAQADKESDERKAILDRLDDGAKEFKRITDTLGNYSKSRRRDRHNIKVLMSRVDGLENGCKARHKETA
jgi:hypothetical protein